VPCALWHVNVLYVYNTHIFDNNEEEFYFVRWELNTNIFRQGRTVVGNLDKGSREAMTGIL
jgi:hypothetical protein